MAQDAIGEKYGVQEMAAWLVIVVLVTLIVKTLSFLFIPLSLALLIFFALGMPLEFLRRFGVPGWLRIMLVVLLVLGCMYLVGWLVHANVRECIAQKPVIEQQLSGHAACVLNYFGMSVEQGKEMMGAFFGSMDSKKLEPLGSFLQAAGGSFFHFLGSTVWVVLFLIFMLAEREGLQGRLHNAFGKERAAKIIKVGGRISLAVEEYLGLKTMISLLVGVLTAIALWMFGVHFALLWGLLTFLLNFIPNIGALMATVPPVLVALLQFGSFGLALIVTGVLVSIHLVVGNYLEPKIMGRGLDLSPLVVLFSLVFWGWMWGGVGMLLAVPITAAVKIAMEEYKPTQVVAKMISEE
ncbi:MAG: AI-2E family transporter [Desulfurivibrionaceae bacterium]